METAFAIIKLIGALALIIVLINVLMRYLNKYMNKGTANMRILQKIALNKNLSLGIVEILGVYYVMSFSEQNVQIIKELTPEEIEIFKNNLHANQELTLEQANRFKDILKSVLDKSKKRKNNNED
ncbi:flagellar biosynthetic protein FliO [Ligilactobacillus sp. WILCCON 0076]|uniref:Flagellar biosynthetic protein FliO n=1 Tax=Ligilactobacillus ubinensis TaxID=2876789 RepID=A0A9X2JKI4_9LACO|nr:flagellar biosynthetic protein FliO [Ligilactobacillus ubinensis]MCP0886242.1 flagellar biosynthetic protein FliO [Ligilactobacillus ubinensis]